MKLPQQSIMMDIQGLTLTEQEKENLVSPLVGGVILFKRNFESSQQLMKLTQSIRQCRNEPILIAADQEGGRVQRFANDGFTKIPAMGKLAEYVQTTAAIINTKQLVQDVAWVMASECLAHGIDLSFAPVLDVNNGSDVIGDRAFAKSANDVIKYATDWCRGMKQANMATVAKHFPGHGSTKEDSHIAAPLDTRSLDEIRQTDMVVFETLIKQNLINGVMPAHVVYNQVDNLPAGYSSVWLNDILKQQLKFDGVMFSDDLSMVGAGEDLTYSEKASKALSAGVNMLLMCNAPEKVQQVLNGHECQQTSSTPIQQLIVKNKPSLHELQQSKRWLTTKQTIIKIHQQLG